jgi:hypothetical protein
MLVQTVEFLKYRHERAAQYFLGEAAKINHENAYRFAHANWPSHHWGIGQNGSAASIVYHVAAWRRLTLPVLHGDTVMMGADDFQPDLAPPIDDWSGILEWANSETRSWSDALKTLSQGDLERRIDWGTDGTPELASVVWSIIEHDIQHASQLEYLQQMYLRELA